jgi:hypothetical protein
MLKKRFSCFPKDLLLEAAAIKHFVSISLNKLERLSLQDTSELTFEAYPSETPNMPCSKY